VRWRREGDGLVVDEWTPDTLMERNERLARLMRKGRPWKLINGHLIERQSEMDRTANDLHAAMQLQRGQSKQMLRELELSGVPMMAEGTYGALGSYPLQSELPSVTATTTESGLLSAANGGIYMPIPSNSTLAPQAYRFVLAGRVTTTATAANYTWTIRLGNANTSPSLGASAAIAKTASITNAVFIEKGDITIQQVGPPGTNAKAMGHFDAKLNSVANGAYIAWAWGSSAQASFDSTVSPNASANGGQVWLGITASAAAADPFIVGAVHYMDWNVKEEAEGTPEEHPWDGVKTHGHNPFDDLAV
jgi:hypothetical protein